MPDNLCKEDELFVCLACGKTSKSRYGSDSHGWDVSCMLNGEVFKKNRLMFDVGRVVKINVSNDCGAEE